MARQGLLQCCCVLQSIDELINYWKWDDEWNGGVAY
jgi:hypothetical protein